MCVLTILFHICLEELDKAMRQKILSVGEDLIKLSLFRGAMITCLENSFLTPQKRLLEKGT